MNTKHYSSPEARERERRHQFGQPEGNPPCPLPQARSMREFYRWVENEATQEELQEYANNTEKPYVRRKFVQAMTAANTPQDFFDLTNQTHGAPKQVIETVDAPTVIIDLSIDDDEEDEKPKRKGKK